ncbi:hypothetical protein CMQ_4201 [Grosmannia clavigera kw1407]|uniref:C2H2-type domain-containing protein n=1 Tax=Grosmannia clavigera (strain kw1407 / UAMH 11150) TaxID=655863 RepID=F0X9Y1_GROCL|nr:uncharacterized protein CMQ_4201 [Grosmannia clavigera kw1407]EFX06132.1 hypothetical protein CMQ_4201 [Grosmannia clavigera kw1407]
MPSQPLPGGGLPRRSSSGLPPLQEQEHRPAVTSTSTSALSVLPGLSTRALAPQTHELRTALAEGTLVTRFQALLMRDDTRQALFRERLTAGQLQQLFGLGLPPTLRIMLMNTLGDVAWFRELPATERTAVETRFRAQPGDGTTATPIPVPVPSPSPSPIPVEVKRPIFKARRTGRSVLSPTANRLLLHDRRASSGSRLSTTSSTASSVAAADAKARRRAASDPPVEPQPAAIASDLLPPKRALSEAESDSSSSGKKRSKRPKLMGPETSSEALSAKTPSASSSARKKASVPAAREIIEIEDDDDEVAKDADETEDDTSDSNTSEDEVLADTTRSSGSAAAPQPPRRILNALSGRPYDMWQGKELLLRWDGFPDDPHELLETAKGAAIPDNYQLSGPLATPWVCPIRPCGRHFLSLANMGLHFKINHQFALLHDNLDGSFSPVPDVAKAPGQLGVWVISRAKPKPKPKPQLQLQLQLQRSEKPATEQPPVLPQLSQFRSTSGPVIPKDTAPRSERERERPDRRLLLKNEIVMATPGREYLVLPLELRGTEKNNSSFGVPLPDGYQYSTYPKHPWICPVRTCRSVFLRIPNLGAHFTRKHRRRLLNDNGDGTLSEIGKHDAARGIVVSQTRRKAAELEPLAVPLPPGYNTATAVAAAEPTETTPSTVYNTVPHEVIDTVLLGPLAHTTPTWEYAQSLLVRHCEQMPTKGYVPLFAQLARLRDIQWNELWTARHPFHDTLPRDVSSLIFQLTGERNKLPCQYCREGKGPFAGCVILPVHAPVELHAAVTCCANCLYHCGQAGCSLKTHLRDRFGVLFPDVDLDAERHRLNLPSTSSADAVTDDSLDRGPASSAFSRRSERIAVKESVADGLAAPGTDSAGMGSTSVKRSRSGNATPQPAPATVMTGANASIADSTGQLLEMEDWKVAPGHVEVQRAARPGGEIRTESVAFSNAYLTTPGQLVRIDHNLSFCVQVVRPGATQVFNPDASATYVCSLAAGKLRVRVDDAEFIVGPHSMFQVRPGQCFTVQNRLYVDAYLHMSALRNLP